MLKFLYNKKGITLVELIIVTAIMGLIIAIAFSIQIFGTTTFNKGSNQSIVQHNVRMAAKYITDEIRNVETIQILAGVPATLDPQKNYIFVEGNTIKHINIESSIDKEIFYEDSNDFSLVMVFNKNSDKMLNFSIDAANKGQDFDVVSEVLPLNMEDSSNFTGTSGGNVLAYSNPLADSEVVSIDKMLLSLKNLNQFLQEESGILTLLPPPDPNLIRLPTSGQNGSTINWVSDTNDIIKNDGTVIRPGIGQGNVEVVLTATLSKGVEESDKIFTVKVSDLDALVIENTALPTATEGSNYNHIFTATGGEGGYTFSTSNDDELLLLDHGLTLESNGILSGEPSGPAFGFEVIVTDEYVLGPNGSTSPNETSENVILTIATTTP